VALALSVNLPKNNPDVSITSSVDISDISIIDARRKAMEEGLTNVQF